MKADYEAFKNVSVFENFMLNACQFSSAKSVAVNGLMKAQLFDDNGVRKGFSKFKADCRQITDIVNDTWMRTEYDSGVRQAVAGDMFRAFKDDKDIYEFWQYLQTTSANPREDHLELVGNIYRIGDPDGDAVFPPGGWNCLPSGSLILTTSGWKEIQDLKVNQTVIGGSGHECAIISTHKNNFNGQIIGIINKGGQAFYTKNHRILTIEGWKQSDSVNIGDILVDLRKSGFFNAMICYVNNCYIFGRNKTMPFIIKWQSGMIERFNSNIKFRYKNVNPIFSTIKIMNRIERFKIVQYFKFIISRISSCINMQFGVSSVQSTSGFSHFSANFGSESRSANFKFIRNSFNIITSFFSFPKIRVRNLSNIISHSAGCLLFPIFIVYPLYLYALGIVTNWYIKSSKNFRHNPIVCNIPFFRNIIKRFVLNDVQFIKDNGDAAPFNFFDSGYMALYSVFVHNKLTVIEDVKIHNHNDFVYNLTIENDVSYITQTGIVHNCSCGAEQVDQQYLDENNKTPRTNEEASEDLQNHVDPQFRFDPSVQGILPKEGHSYFQALPNANEADGSTFGITGTTAQKTQLKAVGMHQLVELFHTWKSEYHSNGLDEVTFQCKPLFTNVFFNHKSIVAIAKHARGTHNLADAIEAPQEVWSSWVNPNTQKDVKRFYLKGNYAVETVNSFVVDAHLVDDINRFRKGVLIY